jgi:DNA-binding GntR family transcriptional regulator
MQERKRYKEHAKRHLHLLAPPEKESSDEASAAMREHVSSMLRNITEIRGLLKA